MRTTEHSTKTPVATTGILAMLRGLLHVKGRGAPSTHRFALVIAAFVILPGAVVSASAQAADIHDFLSSPSEEISKGVPAGAKAAGGEPAVTGPVGGKYGTWMTVSPGETSAESGHLWITGYGGVDEFNASSGKWESQLEHVGGQYGHDGQFGVAVGSSTGERQVYVTDGEVVAVFGPTGKLQEMWTGSDTPDGSFKRADSPTGLAVDRSTSAFDEHEGDVYVGTSGHSSAETGYGATESSKAVVDVFEPKADGKERYVTQFTGRCLTENTVVGSTGCEGDEIVPFIVDEARRVAVDPVSGDVLVSDGNAVDIFKPLALNQYEFVRQITGIPDHPFETIDAVAYGGGEGDGDLHIAEDFAVYQFSSEGVYEGILTETPMGHFQGVTSVAVDPVSGEGDPAGGDIYVSDGGSGGRVDVFGPDKVIPDVVSGTASEVTPSSAVLNGTVNPLKEGEVSCRFEWGTSEALGQGAECEPKEVAEGSTPAKVHSEELKNLQPDTTYYYRLQATNKNGTNTGEGFQALTCEGRQSAAACFTTAGPGIKSETVSDVAATSATFNAEINPNGRSTSYYFEYGATTGYGSVAPAAPGEAIGSGESAAAVSQHVQQGLAAGTVYHYRAVAVSEVPIEVAPYKFETKVETFYGTDQSFKTQGPGGFGLPDGREWEMVSPPQKDGALIELDHEGGESSEAAAGGDAMTYVTNVPTELGVAGYSNFEQVLSRRGPGGWVTSDLAVAHYRATGQAVNAGEEYRFFSENLEQGVVQPLGLFAPCNSSEGAPEPCLSPDASEQTAFLHTDFLNGNVDEPCTSLCYIPLVTGCPPAGQECAPGVKEHANVPPGTVFGQVGQGGPAAGAPCGFSVNGSVVAKFCGPYFDGATPDLRHVVLNGPGGVEEWSAGAPPSEQLQPIPLLPVNEHGEELPDEGERWLGSASSGEGSGPSEDERNAISKDGSRVFWSARNGEKIALYMRENANRPPRPAPVGPCNAAGACTIQIGGEGASFAYANPEGSKVFFGEGGSLHVCEIVEAAGELQCEMTNLGTGSLVGASEDGSYVYIESGAGIELRRYDDEPGREGWEAPRLVSVATIEAFSGLQGNISRVSPNGQWLAFVSKRDLTGYDTHDAVTGQLDRELYLYDAQTGHLACASCDPTGSRPVGSASVPSREEFSFGDLTYQPRYLSDSGRVFFDSADGLVPQDVNGTMDVYEYEPEGVGSERARCGSAAESGSDVFKPAHTFEAEGVKGEEGAGCVGLISSGGSAQESVFVDASESGGDVFFTTTSKLAPQDFDTAYDVYDAHECTSASPCAPPPPVAPPECTTADACRAAPTPEPSIYGAPSSQTFSGLGNLAPTPTTPAVLKKTTKKTVACKKGFVKRRGKCVRAKAGKRKAKAKKSNRDRRAG